jgi:hypothetical protein
MTVSINSIDLFLITPHCHFNSKPLSFELSALLRLIMIDPPIEDEHPVVKIIDIQLCCQVHVPQLAHVLLLHLVGDH